MDRFLREWRDDASSRNQLESAIFVGDKLLALTSLDDDALHLARLHFNNGNYTYAESILNRYELVPKRPEARYLAAHCNVKQGKYPAALAILGDKAPQHLIRDAARPNKALASERARDRTKAAQSGGSRSINEPAFDDRDSDVPFEASMCYLRGVCFAKQNAFDRAKECYRDAVRIDIRCFEAWDQLTRNALMAPEEEWELLQDLNFDSVWSEDDLSTSQQAGELAKMLYTSRISKYSHVEEIATTVETLSTHYKLGSNHDILLANAEILFTRCRFREALDLTTQILENDRYNFSVLPVHLACLFELGERNALQLLGTDFTERHPEEPASWLAVGVYYLAIGKIAEARRYFSKSSIMDPHFGPAWIGFAHTFAAEGEHDQATSAYTTAARLFQGTHLPQLFLGMQQLHLHNTDLAQEYLNTANRLCATDPLVLNELGVTYYQEDELDKAVEHFKAALEAARESGSDTKTRFITHANLGHAYRRLGQFEEAVQEYDEVLQAGARDGSVFTAKSMCMLELGRTTEAIVTLHEALALNPQDTFATDMLNRALEEAAAADGVEGDRNMVEVDDALAEQMEMARNRSPRRRGVKAGKQKARVTTSTDEVEVEVDDILME